MPARHPLKDLPLDYFVSADRGVSLKRPLSPSAVLLSPSKRRVLSAEGLYSPEKKRKQTQIPSHQLFTELGSPHQLTPKKLDFAPVSQSVLQPTAERRPSEASSPPGTPVAQIGLPILAPSPKITSASGSSASSHSNHESAADIPRVTHCPPPMLIPREMPVFSDKQTVHWPGFDVYADTHIYIPTLSSLSLSVQPSDRMETLNSEETKENLRPKRVAGKRSTLDVTNTIKAVKAGRTDNFFHGPSDTSIMTMLSPSSKNHCMTPQDKELERKRMKLIMLRETDDDGNEEDDVEQQL
ncbi:hypothetical protein BU17DRAFT_79946 [Hysterangium stoloniferum]|nr:hypothetical protein BU17DRAFT_79946 [Hysterangium stoloniferum]